MEAGYIPIGNAVGTAAPPVAGGGAGGGGVVVQPANVIRAPGLKRGKMEEAISDRQAGCLGLIEIGHVDYTLSMSTAIPIRSITADQFCEPETYSVDIVATSKFRQSGKRVPQRPRLTGGDSHVLKFPYEIVSSPAHPQVAEFRGGPARRRPDSRCRSRFADRTAVGKGVRDHFVCTVICGERRQLIPRIACARAPAFACRRLVSSHTGQLQLLRGSTIMDIL
ncbi:hypothetical protein EVAR_78942_1 [Eumeta japonica]|uniref:Uncharacterized protein n=1 Tax=Eumeta variegata TaxID=151549 RepID=A0A4C1U2G2_EUMVA|nr:hypothetical protein EVAR_78942_1 [Eumeta japonica]